MSSDHHHFNIFTYCNYFQLLKDYPDLKQYRDCWPINDLMQTRLRAIAAQQQRREESAASALLREGKSLVYCYAIA
jgi:hypothetical protein